MAGSLALADTDANPHAAAMAAMARLFVGHVSFDGELLTEVRPVSACRTSFVTEKGATTIDWSRLSDPAPRTMSGKDVIQLVTPEADHDLSTPLSAGSDRQGRRMDSVIGFLYLDCANRR